MLYTRDDGIISREEKAEAGESSYNFYLSDGHGDVRQLTDETGEVTDSYSYNSFGELKESHGETDNPYLYTGEYYDEGTGLYYLRARYMNPETGTFTSMDTYRGNAYDPASLHRYTYAQNNPQMYNDPSGHLIGFISLAVNTFCTEVVRNFDYLNVVGMLSGTISCTIAQTLGYEGDYSTLFIKSYLMGAGFAAAYIGACAIAAIFEVQYAVHLFVGGYMAKEYYHELVVAFAFGVTGNWKTALVHLSIAGICLISAVLELGLGIKGAFFASGPKGALAVEISNENFSGVKAFEPPKITTNKNGELTNGAYTLNQNDMLIHVDGKITTKSQFLYNVDANKAVLDASAFADYYNLWKPGSGNVADFANKAKVSVTNGYVGVTGKGELTYNINVYRTSTGYVHGCPGNP